MRDVAVTLTGTLAKYRNGVLHGGDLDYDTPKRSSILLLMIYCIADEFAGFEEETS